MELVHEQAGQHPSEYPADRIVCQVTVYITVISLALRIVLLLAEMSKDRAAKATGYAQAVKDALEQAYRDLGEADAERILAAQAHKDPTDDAFLPDFKRSD